MYLVLYFWSFIYVAHCQVMTISAQTLYSQSGLLCRYLVC
jgi:hypothetical protein